MPNQLPPTRAVLCGVRGVMIMERAPQGLEPYDALPIASEALPKPTISGQLA